jgi:hypothetical protein
VAPVVVLLDTLLAPSSNGVGKVYQHLKDILGTAATQQAESSLQHRVKVSILNLDRSKARGQRATQGALEVGTASSPTRISAYDQLVHPGAQSESQECWQCHVGDNNA